MEQQIFEIIYGGYPIRYAFHYPKTRWRFRKYIHRSASAVYDIMASAERMAATRAALPEESGDDYVEYRTLISLTAHALLPHNRCIMHTVSFVWNDYAWLLTAPSGTGKTTQYLNWQRLYPGEITMICGDMTVLEHRESGSIWVHSSSWNGKENIGSYGLSAPLAGIVFLAQGPVNFIEVLSPRDAVVPLIQQFMMRPDSETEILLLSRLVGQILQAVPVWKMTNLGNDDSTEILRNTLAIRMKELTGGASHDL